MKDKTRDSKSHDGTVRHDLSISETLNENPIHRYLLNGWVEGFGPRVRSEVHDDHDVLGSGPYQCQYWLKESLPQEVLDTLWFDSESSDFYCYSSDRTSLETILDVMTDVIDKLDRCFEEYTTQKLSVFNDVVGKVAFKDRPNVGFPHATQIGVNAG